MKVGTWALGLVLLGLGSVGCGRPLAGSCAQTNGGTVISCIEYREGYTQQQVQAVCTGNPNVSFSTGECPAESRVGRCDVSISAVGVTVSEVVNYYPPVSAEMAMMQCNQFSIGGKTATFTAN